MQLFAHLSGPVVPDAKVAIPALAQLCEEELGISSPIVPNSLPAKTTQIMYPWNVTAG